MTMLRRSVLLLLLAPAPAAAPQSPPYTLQIPVDEISLTFHAALANGAPVTHLTRGDLALTDNGQPPSQILLLQELDDLPIRAGFLFDTSASMLADIDFNRSILHTYASVLLRKGYDRAFVMQFDTDTLTRQPWTDDDSAIAAGAAAVGLTADRMDPLTAIFDSLYTTCRDQWKPDSGHPTGNFILLFSDGDDDASHVWLSEAVDMCQRTRTAIYAMVNSSQWRNSSGQQTLKDLVSQTGGRLFFHPRGEQILRDLQVIEAEQRNQYRLVYKPAGFRADSSFHRIRLTCSVKGARIAVRSGYYAFPRH
jgi:Ca-activated chloride channel homolog